MVFVFHHLAYFTKQNTLQVFFYMQADMTALTIQSNKIVLNEVKDKWALLEPLYGKSVTDFFGQASSRPAT